MKTRAWTPWLLVCSVGLTQSLDARAQPGSADARVESVLTDQAKQLYKDGVKEAARGEWDKARDLFRAAFRLKHHFQIAFNLGQAELRAGEPVQAAEHLTFFLREAEGADESERQISQEMLREAQQQIGRLTISAAQPGAEVVVDGVLQGKTPLGREVFVTPGQHLVQARLEGYEPTSEVPTVTAGTSLQVELRLTKVPGKEPESGANKQVIIVGGALAGGAAVLGVGFLIGSAVKAGERKNPQPTGCPSPACASYDAADSAYHSFQDAATYTFIAAALIGAGTLVYALVAPDFKSSPKVTTTVLAGPGLAGVQATIRW
jgi:hypothetical protein